MEYDDLGRYFAVFGRSSRNERFSSAPLSSALQADRDAAYAVVAVPCQAPSINALNNPPADVRTQAGTSQSSPALQQKAMVDTGKDVKSPDVAAPIN